jgi:ribonuclease HI
MKHITIHTDGACSVNPGPGGYAAILEFDGREKAITGGFRRTTNNRMELMAVIKGLEALKEPCEVTLYTDSRYIVDAVNLGWLRQWRAKRWKRADKKKVLNPDLWIQLLQQLGRHKVEFKWIAGHAGNFLNERCDRMAVEMSLLPDLPEDAVYEQGGAKAEELL